VEAVHDILSNPPAPLQAHPWRVRVGEWVCAVLQTQTAKPDTLVHLLASLKMLVPQCIAREHLKTFTTHLLFIPLASRVRSPHIFTLSASDDIAPNEARETASSVLERSPEILHQNKTPNLRRNSRSSHPWSIFTHSPFAIRNGPRYTLDADRPA